MTTTIRLSGEEVESLIREYLIKKATVESIEEVTFGYGETDFFRKPEYVYVDCKVELDI